MVTGFNSNRNNSFINMGVIVIFSCVWFNLSFTVTYVIKIVVFDRGLTGAVTVVTLVLLNKKKKSVVLCLQIPTSCHGLNHKWHLYLRALTPLMKRKHLRPCWPYSLSAHTVSVQIVSLSLPLLTSASTFFSFYRLFSLSLSPFQLYHHFQVTRLRHWTEVEESGATRACRCDSTCWQKQGFTHINE